MRQHLKNILIALVAINPVYGISAKSMIPDKVTVFDLRESGSKYYRIPAIARCADGSLVALADKRGNSARDLPNIISVVAKRSLDGGKTWGDAVTIAEGDSLAGHTYGDPAIICDRKTGTLISVFSGDTGFFYSNKDKRSAFYVSRSFDNGQTWETPRDVAEMLYKDEWQGSFCASGSMLQTADGRIMFATCTRTNPKMEFVDIYNFVCSSDDCGETWSVLNPQGKIPTDGMGNETKLMELADGRLLMSMRNPGNRRFSYSEDGGKTWSEETIVSDLIEPDCNGDIMAVAMPDGQRLLLQSLPADSEERKQVSLYISGDEGDTWPVKYEITPEESGYSALVDLKDGSVGCFYEEGSWDKEKQDPVGYRLVFVKLNMNDLIKGTVLEKKDNN